MIIAAIDMDIVSKFLKFGLVGASGMIVDFGITFLMKEKFRLQKYLSNALGFCVAVTTNFFLNRWWTFSSLSHEVAQQFSNFALVAIAGLALNSFILWLMIREAKVKFYFAKLIAIGVVTFWNFGINYFYVFSRP